MFKLLEKWLLKGYDRKISDLSLSNVARFSRGNVVAQIGRIHTSDKNAKRSLLADRALARMPD